VSNAVGEQPQSGWDNPAGTPDAGPTLSVVADLRPGGRFVMFRLEPFEGGTVLTLTHEDLPDEAARTSHEEGWNSLLDKLPVFLGDCE
jgi:uncharacterized protein YndB with AHSA1/START domain